MLIYNVFGRYVGVKRVENHWLVFRADMTDRKFSRLYEIIIPDELTEAEIAGWLGDIFHEAASARHPDVTRIE
ncbi:conserved hypothetical protein [Serratia proteamaculans]|uniref:DUF7661 family protein n=1 Tax=Serratia proteamaculans TaxID=28151 RepID=UPI0009F7F06C|nr:hypothetical protein [Serratia proteamaculans]SMB48196.1 conserved hypothetical protein [Serratia proteamaculans]